MRLWFEWGRSLRAEAKIGGERGLTAVLYVSTLPGITWEEDYEGDDEDDDDDDGDGVEE